MIDTVSKVDVFRDFDHARYGVLARTVQVLLAHGRSDLACMAVKQFAASLRREPIRPETALYAAIHMRLATAIEDHFGIVTVGAFLGIPPRSLLAIHGLGMTAVEAQQKLRRAVELGEQPEFINREDELSFEFDEDRIRQWTFHLSEAVKSIEKKTEVPTVSNAEPSKPISVIEALRVLASKNTEAIAEIDKRIAEHEEKIRELRVMRDMVAGPTRAARRSLTSDGKLEEYKQLASKMAALMQRGKTYRATQLSTLMGDIGFTKIGRIVANNQDLFRKRGPEISLR